MKKVSFIGLGVMGYPMAGHLVKAGYQVTVYNRTQSKAQAWCEEYNGQWAATPAEAAKDADVVLVCVGNDDDVREVTTGSSGVLSSMKAGSLLVDHTTTSAELARELDVAAADKQVKFMDAPVSGGQAGAVNGQLTIMCGASETVFTEAEAVISAYARFARRLGDVGCGQLAKMMNQICIAGIVQGLSEALAFGQDAGLDCEQVVDVISKGAAQSWQMENRSSTMLKDEFEFGFAVDWMRKDLDIALNQARMQGSHLPLTALVDQFYSEVQRMGGNRWDTSSLIARLKK